MNPRATATSFSLCGALGALYFVACGTPPAPASPTPDSAASAVTSSPPAATSTEPAASAASPATSVAAPEPAASASSAKPGKKPPRAPGPPLTITEGDKEATGLFAFAGGILKLSTGAELHVPRETVTQGLLFTLAVNSGKNAARVAAYRGLVGEVYRVFVRKEEEQNTPLPLTATGSPFVIKLPVPKATKTANLAFAPIVEGKQTPKYTVVAGLRIDEGASGSIAVFEVPNLVGDGIVHVTSAPPTP